MSRYERKAHSGAARVFDSETEPQLLTNFCLPSIDCLTTTTTTNVLIIVTLHKVAGALYISDLTSAARPAATDGATHCLC